MSFLSNHPKTASALLVFGSLLLACAVIETAARLFVAVPAPYPMAPASTVGDSRGFWTMKPGFAGAFDNRVDFRAKAVTVGPDGARTIPCARAVTGASPRVFLIGDSQTFGWGLDDAEAWPNRLQCLLDDRRPGAFHVVNLAVPGTQADQYWQRGYTQVIPALRGGDTVVVSLTWNDLVTFYAGDAAVARALEIAGLRERAGVEPLSVAAVPAPARGTGPAHDGRDPLAYHPTAPLQVLNPETWRYRLHRKFGVFVPSFDSFWAFVDSLGSISAAVHVAVPKLRLLYYRLRPDTAFQAKVSHRGFDQNFLVLKALEHLVVERGGRFLVQLLPNRLFFDDAYYRSYSKNGVAFPARDYMGHVSAPRCASLGLTCVNRFDALKTADVDAYSFPFDGHYNAAGAARIADALGADILGR